MATRPTVHVTGVHQPNIAAECAASIAACASANGCFTPNGLLVSEKCVETISRDITKERCVSQGFGVAPVRG